MAQREQEAIRRVVLLLAKSRPTWRSRGIHVRHFDVIVRALKAALNHPVQEAVLMRTYARVDSLLDVEVGRASLPSAASLDFDALRCEVRALRERRALSPPTRDEALADARQFLKAQCEGCGAVDNLNAHHQDHDWCNNVPSNISTLCHDCHVKAHKASGGFMNSAGAVLPAKSDEELQEAANWMVKLLCKELKELHAWVPGDDTPRLCFRSSGYFFSQAKRRFGISLWQNGEFGFYAKKALKAAGLEENHLYAVLRFWKRSRSRKRQ